MHVYTHICTHICAIFKNVSPNYLALFLKNNKQLYFQLHMVSEAQLLCRHPGECYFNRVEWGRKEKSEHVQPSVWERGREEGGSLIRVSSLVFSVLKVFGSFLHWRELPRSMCRPQQWCPPQMARPRHRPSPCLLFPSSHIYQKSSSSCPIVLEGWSPKPRPKGHKTGPLHVCQLWIPGECCLHFIVPIGHVCQGACSPLPTSLPTFFFLWAENILSQPPEKYLSLEFTPNEMLFFSLSSFSLFGDVGSFSSFCNKGSRWKRNRSLLKKEDITSSFISLTVHPAAPAPRCKSVAGRVFQGSGWGE